MNSRISASKCRYNRPKALPNKHLSQGNSSFNSQTDKQQQLGTNAAFARFNEKERETFERLLENDVAFDQAVILIQTSSLELINEHIQAGIHKTKQNPPGFLIASIKENYQQPVPNPETTTRIESVPVAEETRTTEVSQTQADDEKIRVTAELVDIGVPSTIASLTVSIYSAERIHRQIRSGKHLTAKNPIAFLLASIRNDYAVSEPIPGSEADQVRQKERNATRHIQPVIQPQKMLQPMPIPEHQFDISAARFAQVSEQERTIFEQLAQQEIEIAPPFWALGLLKHDGFKHKAIQGLIRTKAIKLWQCATLQQMTSYA